MNRGNNGFFLLLVLALLILGIQQGTAIPTNDRQARFNGFTNTIRDCLERDYFVHFDAALEERSSKSQPGHFRFACSDGETHIISYTDLDDLLVGADEGEPGRYIGADPSNSDRVIIEKDFLVNGKSDSICILLFC